MRHIAREFFIANAPELHRYVLVERQQWIAVVQRQRRRECHVGRIGRLAIAAPHGVRLLEHGALQVVVVAVVAQR